MQHAKFSFHRDLGGLEVLHNIDKKEDFGRHSHSGYTLALVESGAQKFYRSGGEHVAQQHSIILINAEQVHDCRKSFRRPFFISLFVPNARAFLINFWEVAAP